MLPDMDLKSRFLRVTYTADGASERIHILMIQLVRLQMTLSYKGQATIRIFAKKRSIKAIIYLFFLTELLRSETRSLLMQMTLID